MNLVINANNLKKKKIYYLNDFSYFNKNKQSIKFTNYYMERNSIPYLGATGEFHFSRVEEFRWEDEIIKMKNCGIDTIATYLFWIHHEEQEGIFNFKDNKNIRKFILLCKKHHMDVIARVGPFCHGEVRNGGLPDWLYGKPFTVRSTDAGFLRYTKRLFKEYAKQFEGLYFKDGGPIIAVQVDNEYNHSSAPWEMTANTSNEWVNKGVNSDNYMNAIKKIMIEVGMTPAFFTATAWGGAVVPKDVMPLWGGYAYRPWIFYSYKGKHPCTEEYIYQNFHKDGFICTNDFKPSYKPETRPYLCCEMGGGSMCSYYYRGKFDYKSVDAMANIKLASGCNLLGYYMFQGGNNPLGINNQFLNEGQVPKICYDYQAPLGSFGQVRESYRRLKCLHYFLKGFGKDLATYQTVLPKDANKINPYDLNTLRYAVRTNGYAGYLFINNFQDHANVKDKKDINISIKLDKEIIKFNKLSIKGGENAILPFNLNMDGILLKSATAQLISKINNLYIFFIIPNMIPTFKFENKVKVINKNNHYYVSKGNKKIEILLLTREEANNFYLYKNSYVITNGDLLTDYVESINNKVSIKIKDKEYKLSNKLEQFKVSFKEVSNSKYIIQLPKDIFKKHDDYLLSIKYLGDIIYVYCNDKLITDHFSDGENNPLEIGLKGYKKDLEASNYQLVVSITPLKIGKTVETSSMAARSEKVKSISYKIVKLNLNPIYKYKLPTK